MLRNLLVPNQVRILSIEIERNNITFAGDRYGDQAFLPLSILHRTTISTHYDSLLETVRKINQIIEKSNENHPKFSY